MAKEAGQPNSTADGAPERGRPTRWPSARRLPAVVAALIGTVLSIAAYQREVAESTKLHRLELERTADFHANLLQSQLTARETATMAFAGLFSADPTVNRHEVRAYARSLSTRLPSLVAIGWLPRTPPSRAGEVIEALRRLGTGDAAIRDRDGWPVDPAALDRDLFPVILAEPQEMEPAVLGFDAAAAPDHRRALDRARDTGQAAAVPRIPLMQEPDVFGTILYTPVYWGKETALGANGTTDAVGPPDALRGYMGATFRLDELIRAGLAPHPSDRMRTYVLDMALPPGERLLQAVSADGTAFQPGRAELSEARLENSGLLRRTVRWGDREWTILFEPTETGPYTRPVWVLVYGLLLTGAVTAYLTLQTRSTMRLEQEIEARRETERRLAESNAQKDLLMREVNHRVKNSLQLVTSLLSMQGRQVADEPSRREFEEAVARVRAIAQLHERLYLGNSVARIDFGSYLKLLCSDLTATAPDCECRIQAAPIELPTDQAIPLGLVVVELATNAIKHGQPQDGSPGVIDIAFGPRGEDAVELTVRDYGAGLPPAFKPERPGNSLGMRVITGLVRQLSAELHVENAEPGACWSLRIPTAPDTASTASAPGSGGDERDLRS